MKQNWKPGTMIYPLPAVMVTCGADSAEWNVMTASWTGTVCTNPAMCYVSIRPERHSFALVKKNMEFTINVTTQDLARATDWCGVKSGRDFDKFKKMHLTPVAGVTVKCPYIEESPLSVECRVKQILDLGSHSMFIAEVLNVIADDRYIDPVTGRFDLETARLLVYSHGHYYAMGERIGRFGWTVQKKKK